MASERRYGQAEVREILRRVQEPNRTAAGHDGEGLTRQELLETAKEVGLSEADVGAALVRYEGDQELTRYEAEVRQLSQRHFTTHALWFSVVNGLLLGINLMAGGPLWFFIPLAIWGLFLLLHLREVASPHPDRLRQKAEKRAARQRLRDSSKALGQALGRGAAELMSVTARKIDDHVDRSRGR